MKELWLGFDHNGTNLPKVYYLKLLSSKFYNHNTVGSSFKFSVLKLRSMKILPSHTHLLLLKKKRAFVVIASTYS